MLLAASTRAVPTPTVKPEPLDVIPSGLSIDEVMEHLDAARRRWPGAEVRRGSRNRFEIWPGSSP
jgi:hypothetical protein